MNRRPLGPTADYAKPLVDDDGRLIPLARKLRVRLCEGRMPDSCWVVRSASWACRDHYAAVQLVTGVWVMAHRHAWVSRHGRDIPRGFVIHHKCFSKRCVNPEHLQLATFGENSRLSNFPERFYELPKAAA